MKCLPADGNAEGALNPVVRGGSTLPATIFIVASPIVFALFSVALPVGTKMTAYAILFSVHMVFDA